RPRETPGEDWRHRAERARREVSDLHGRGRRRGVPEHARPAEVVEVVSRSLLMPVADAEAGDRAVDSPFGGLVGSDAEPSRDTGPERLEHDVRFAHQLQGWPRVALEIELA